MRLKKHTAAAAFHLQLSAILEKVMVLAVEEIKELMFDFCEEISREKAQNTDLCERTGQGQEETDFQTPEHFYVEPRDASSESYEQSIQTSSREDAKEKHSREQNYEKFPVNDDFTFSAQESPSCKFERAATSCSKNPATNPEEDCLQEDGSKQSSFEPPEDSKDHLIDYNSPDEAQSSSPYEDFPANQGHARDVEFHVKQEEETPAFETGRNIDDIHSNVEQEMNFEHFNARSEETHNPPLGNPSGAILDIFPFALPEQQQLNAFISSQEAQFAGHSELRLPPSKQVKKYTCDFCSKKFCYPSDLKHHRLWHTRERTHVCQICGKAFITRSHLRRHEVMHLDAQPSVCQICGYKTSRLIYLKEHMRTHAKKNHV